MAVIIREEKVIEGKAYTVKVYRTRPGRLVTDGEKKRAEQLDVALSEKLKQLQREMEEMGLLGLRGKKGKVLRLWHEVGKRLDFVTDSSVVSPEDREYTWRAIYDHAGSLAPGPLTERAKRDPDTSHFSYCHRLSRFPWEFVESAGDWTSWSEFFDRKETKNDPRIIEWLGQKARQGGVAARQNWLRPLTKAIHKEFGDTDTTVFSVAELYERLDRIFAQTRQNGQG
ncbi:MAG: hypothetical protein HYX92_17365 [Chloroflexi bacterium]|nr:hypothetical protein [Chloroflexota bacterium]